MPQCRDAMRCLGLRGSCSWGAHPHMRWPYWRNHMRIMRMTQEASMSIFVPRPAPSVDSRVCVCVCVRVRVFVMNRRAGPLDESGTCADSVCVCEYTRTWVYPCLKFVSVCWLVDLFCVSSSPTTSYTAVGRRLQEETSPGSRCLGRSTGTGHELPSSLFPSALQASQALLPSPLVPIRSSFVVCGGYVSAAGGRHRLLLVPSQTSQNTCYHLIRLLLGPLRRTELFDDRHTTTHCPV